MEWLGQNPDWCGQGIKGWVVGKKQMALFRWGNSSIVRRDYWIQGGLLLFLKEKIEIPRASSHRREEVEDSGEKVSNPFRAVHGRTEQMGPELRWNSPLMASGALPPL